MPFVSSTTPTALKKPTSSRFAATSYFTISTIPKKWAKLKWSSQNRRRSSKTTSVCAHRKVLIDDPQHGAIAYGDGITTRRHTFQKYFQQAELKAYIDQVLGMDAIPLLHQKHQTLTPDYPGYAKFLKLSQQEDRWGLLEDMAAILDRRGWQHCLRRHGTELRGHRLIRQTQENQG